MLNQGIELSVLTCTTLVHLRASFLSVVHLTMLARSVSFFRSSSLLLLVTIGISFLASCNAATKFSFFPLNFFGPIPEVIHFKFFPEDGVKYRKDFEDKFGVHGKHFIQMLSNGVKNNISNPHSMEDSDTIKTNASSKIAPALKLASTPFKGHDI